MKTSAEVPAGSVVIGYDGSDHSTYALRWAADEADLDGRSLTVVTVLQPLVGYGLAGLAGAAGSWTPPVEVREAIRKHAQDELDTARANLHQSMPDLQVQTLICEGDPRQVLLDLSRDAASLFVGSRGRGAVKSLVLGSVSVAVARAAECPVFVIRPSAPSRVRSGVLVGTDCGEGTRSTLEFAYRQAALRDLPLTVMYCVGGVESMYGLASVLDAAVEGYDAERRELAEAVAGMAEKFPEVTVRTQLGHGAADLCLVQESEHMDLVVLGHHGGRSLGDMIHLGSFVAPVLENASCPVAVAVDRSGDRAKTVAR